MEGQRHEEEDSAEKNPGLTRRRLVEGLVGAATLVAVGGVADAFAGGEMLMRPPGGQSEGSLLGTCIRCDRCRSICPRDAIGIATIEDGLINVRTPKMNFRIGYCDACNGSFKCIHSCPTSTLNSFDKTSQKLGIAVIDLDRCETYGISARCKVDCITACPEQALSLDKNNRLVIDGTLCWGCGICEYACPSNSYRVYTGSSKRGINIEPWGGVEVD